MRVSFRCCKLYSILSFERCSYTCLFLHSRAYLPYLVLQLSFFRPFSTTMRFYPSKIKIIYNVLQKQSLRAAYCLFTRALLLVVIVNVTWNGRGVFCLFAWCWINRCGVYTCRHTKGVIWWNRRNCSKEDGTFTNLIYYLTNFMLVRQIVYYLLGYVMEAFFFLCGDLIKIPRYCIFYGCSPAQPLNHQASPTAPSRLIGTLKWPCFGRGTRSYRDGKDVSEEAEGHEWWVAFKVDLSHTISGEELRWHARGKKERKLEEETI